MMKNISTIPAREIIQPLTEPLLATFSQVKKDQEKFVFQIQTSLAILFLITSPIFSFLFFFDELVVQTLFDEKWYKYSSILGLLSFFILNFSVAAIFQQALISLSKVRFLFYYDLITFFILLSGLIVFFNGSLDEFAQIRVMYAMSTLFILVIMVWVVIKFSLINVLFLLSPIILANVLAVITSKFVLLYFTGFTSLIFTHFFITGFIFVGVYLLGLVFLYTLGRSVGVIKEFNKWLADLATSRLPILKRVLSE